VNGHAEIENTFSHLEVGHNTVENVTLLRSFGVYSSNLQPILCNTYNPATEIYFVLIAFKYE